MIVVSRGRRIHRVQRGVVTTVVVMVVVIVVRGRVGVGWQFCVGSQVASGESLVVGDDDEVTKIAAKLKIGGPRD
jgi:hypothetical protein